MFLCGAIFPFSERRVVLCAVEVFYIYFCLVTSLSDMYMGVSGEGVSGVHVRVCM